MTARKRVGDVLAPMMAAVGASLTNLAPLFAAMGEAAGRIRPGLLRGLDTPAGRALRAGPDALDDLARDDSTLLPADEGPCSPTT